MWMFLFMEFLLTSLFLILFMMIAIFFLALLRDL